MLSNFVLAWSEIKSKADVFVLSELMFFILSENRMFTVNRMTLFADFCNAALA